MKILVTGGAGYIGGFMGSALLDANHEVVVIDNLEKGTRDNVDSRATFEQGDFGDPIFLDKLFSNHNFDGIIHFGGFIAMGESMEKPFEYFNNNLSKTLQLIEKARVNNIKNFIFSSTAGVYGNPEKVPIAESYQARPENPYGESKMMVERLFHWYHTIHNMSFVSLRYFNACGAAIDGSRGEAHNPETHLIPNAINSLLTNQKFHLYGTDYKTKDGTCVRDYIHVLDLVQAHLLAIVKISQKPGSYIYNVGTGDGYSNREVLDMVEKISKQSLDIVEEQRRPGDADELVADVTKITNELKFIPKYSDLETIVTSAWKWHSGNGKLKMDS